MKGSDAERHGPGVYREMRVAHLRERKDAEYLEVMFLESARIYKLAKGNPAYSEIVGELRSALGKKCAVQVRCAAAESDVIEEVRTHN